MKIINIHLPQKTYDIVIGNSITEEVSAFIDTRKYSKAFYLIDQAVYRLHESKLREMIGESPYISIVSGEIHKTLKTLESILDEMVKSHLDRHSVLVAIGGGVVGDIGGLAASLFMRGIGLIQIPTTLLSQVDSSVGGKTAINLGHIKNIVGTFYQPDGVFIDTVFLETLPQQEILSGLGEMVKYGFILDYHFFEMLRDRFDDLISLEESVVIESISRSITFKAKVVSEDEKESSIRKILNFGHTVGHGVELQSAFQGSHGQAVAIGMAVEGSIAYHRGYISDTYFKSILSICHKIAFFLDYSDEEIRDMICVMRHDKKNTSGQMTMVLPKSEGKVIIVNDIQEEEIYIGFRSIKDDN
jgi:3-dehydroquinate synthase